MTSLGLESRNSTVAGSGVAWRLCFAASTLLALAFAGCGGDDGKSIMIEITSPTADAVLTVDDDTDTAIPGVQFDVTARSLGVSEATTVLLHVDGSQTDVTTPNEAGVIEFTGVTLPPGEHEMYVRTANNSVESATVSYTLSLLEITSPDDGQIVTVLDDDDGATPGVQVTVVAKAHGIEISQDVTLLVDGREEDSESQDAEGKVTFSSITFATGEYTLQVVAGDIESETIKFSVDDRCAGIQFVSPAPPEAEDSTPVTLTPEDDTDGTPCDTGFTISVMVITDAARGALADVMVNDSPRGSATVGSRMVVFSDVEIPNRGANNPNTLAVQVENAEGVTCVQEFPVDLLVDCQEADVCGAGWHWDTDEQTCVQDENCTDNNPCGANSICEETDTGVTCECDAGYAGELCDACAAGFHDTDPGDNLACELDTECMPNSCGGLGDCADDGGEVVCTCDSGFTGDHCELCDEEAASDPCGDHGACDDATGEPVCVCDRGYADDASSDSPGIDCDACAAGFHNEQGSCVLDTECLPNTCSGHEVECYVISGVVGCLCEDAYTGDFCDTCAEGYHRNDADECVADEVCPASDPCAPNGDCMVVGGIARCDCTSIGHTDDPDQAGIDCDGCLSGFQDNDTDGDCDLSCNPGGQSTCGVHGDCTDVSGTAICICDPGWGGAHCERCATGYHLEGSICVANKNCAANDTCAPYGTCRAVSGIITCDCFDGYTNDASSDSPDADCSVCAQGYHDDDAGSDLVCVPDESCDTDPCGPPVDNDCSDDGGVVVCECGDAYRGNLCEECVDDAETDYHRDLASGRCLPDETCPVTDPCEPHGTCYIDQGVVTCDCTDEEYADDPAVPGIDCDGCADGYQDNDTDGVCEENCETLGGNAWCSDHGVCMDDTGTAYCNCTFPWGGWPGNQCTTCLTLTCGSDGCCPTAGSVCNGISGLCCVPSNDCPDVELGCGPASVADDGCNNTLDCGDCGGVHGHCEGPAGAGECICDVNYAQMEYGGDCVHACGGYVPSVGCCDGDVVVYCTGPEELNYYDCSTAGCGWKDDPDGFYCEGSTNPDDFPGYTLECPPNLDYISPCTEDSYEDNDGDNDTATPVDRTEAIDTVSIYATNCAGDYDVFRIELEDGDVLTAAVTALSGVATYVDVYVYDGMTYDPYYFNTGGVPIEIGGATSNPVGRWYIYPWSVATAADYRLDITVTPGP